MKIMNYIALHHSASVKDVADHFKDAGVARTTVLTVMERLRAKGFLARKKKGGVYHYQAKIPQSEVVQNLVKDFVSKTLGGKITPLLMFLHGDDADLSEKDIADLREIVEQRGQLDKGEGI